jgi:2-methylcitrate dehydratase
MTCTEDQRFSTEYLDPEKRAIGNAVQVFFTDGTATDRVSVDYPVGHRRRRSEGLLLLTVKFEKNLTRRFSPAQSRKISDLALDLPRLRSTPVDAFVNLLVA